MGSPQEGSHLAFYQDFRLCCVVADVSVRRGGDAVVGGGLQAAGESGAGAERGAGEHAHLHDAGLTLGAAIRF